MSAVEDQRRWRPGFGDLGQSYLLFTENAKASGLRRNDADAYRIEFHRHGDENHRSADYIHGHNRHYDDDRLRGWRHDDGHRRTVFIVTTVIVVTATPSRASIISGPR